MSETNDNFRDVRRLLKLKRHEAPPPGYFNRFSGDVLSRIRAGESGGADSFLERLQMESDSPSFLNFFRIFAAKPGLMGGLAMSTCLLLLFAVVMADRPESGSSGEAAIPQVSPEGQTMLASVPLAPAENSGISINTNPVAILQPAATMFGSQQNPLFQQAGFMTQSR